jgi:tRNA (guanine-N7-)-methyltransferase
LICGRLGGQHFKVHDVTESDRPTIYRLDSILTPITLSDWFESLQPLEIELGSGDGSFLLGYAEAHPNLNLIGVERLLGRLQKTDRKARRAGLSNIRIVQIESSYFLKCLLPPGVAQALHIYFPDPWPKKKHRRHRLINPAFPGLARAVLGEKGRVHLRTDDLDYFTQIREVFESSGYFKRTETPRHLLEIQTDFEREFTSKGIRTLEVSYGVET